MTFMTFIALTPPAKRGGFQNASTTKVKNHCKSGYTSNLNLQQYMTFVVLALVKTTAQRSWN